jgi:hypothetical protein
MTRLYTVCSRSPSTPASVSPQVARGNTPCPRLGYPRFLKLCSVVLFYCHCWLARVVDVCAPFKSSAHRSNLIPTVEIQCTPFKSCGRRSNLVLAVQIQCALFKSRTIHQSRTSILYLPYTDVYKGGGWKGVNCTHNSTQQHLHSVQICLVKTTKCPELLKSLSKRSGGTSNQYKRGRTVT